MQIPVQQVSKQAVQGTQQQQEEQSVQQTEDYNEQGKEH
jgi:hypothetical protein